MPLEDRKQKRKKKRRKQLKAQEEIELQELLVHGEKKKSATLLVDETKSTPSVKSLIEAAENFEKTTQPSDVSSEGIVGVTIHGVDCPIIDPLVRHPMVCLYIVDTSVGEFYRKSDPGRSVCYNRENTDYVLPIMTHMFDFQQRKSVVPVWEECLLLNESPSHLLTPHTLLLLELCDVVSSAVASSRHARLGSAAGRHVVAWAFLRPAASSLLQLGQRLRLQLFKPGRAKDSRPLTPAVYEWWGSAARTKYPGSLYMTVSQLEAPATPLSPRPRSQSALQEERGSRVSNSAASTSATGSPVAGGVHGIDEQSTRHSEVHWSRLPGQSCLVLNTCVQTLPVEGSLSVQFSDNGLWLACGRQDIQIYSVPLWQHTTALTGHQGLVYCLRWSPDSKVLLSASADCTVCVWRPFSSKNPLLQMLAHPSFVYCVQFVRPLVLVSGCYDATVRVWRGESHSSYQLIQELLGHSGFVSSVCTSVDGSKVISADSKGFLRVYDVEDDGSLSAGRDLSVRELRGNVISNVVTHPGGHRLLVHSRNSTVCSVDLATGAVLQTFKGCSSERMQTGLCVSACGSLVFACGEDGALVVWDGHTGALRAVYCGLLPPGSAGVHYHPHDHLLATVGLSQPPLYILGYHRNATGEDIGLHIMKNEITAVDVIEAMKKIKTSNKWQKAASKVLQKPSSSTTATDKGLKDKKKKKAGNVEESSGNQPQRVNWPSLPQLEHAIDKSSGEKDLRLLEIIRRMDNIILAAKQSSQVQQ
ncbi:jouberin-like [Macrosteles quadrilineatus]|uniref:jouberin-like n=1 Tax=Macrosteles quadrilineatus TaxID=74068 RepID=UPI0023E177EE|nr:jouberin-like [Macrosteles quadrilineatus]